MNDTEQELDIRVRCPNCSYSNKLRGDAIDYRQCTYWLDSKGDTKEMEEGQCETEFKRIHCEACGYSGDPDEFWV